MIFLVFMFLFAPLSASADTYFAAVSDGVVRALASTPVNGAQPPSDGSCVGCSVITQDQYNTYLAALNAPKPAQVFQQKLAAGLAITSTGSPSLDATYATGDTNLQNVIALVTGAYGRCGATVLDSCTTAFPHNQATYPLLDANGLPHTVTATQLKNIAQALEDYVSDLNQTLVILSGGGSADWPNPSVTIP